MRTHSVTSSPNGKTPIDSAGTERMTRLNPDDPRVEGVLGHYGDSRVGMVDIERVEGDVSIRLSPDHVYKIEFYDDKGELVGMYSQFSEVRFLPPYSGKRGSLFKIDRRLDGGVWWDVWDYSFFMMVRPLIFGPILQRLDSSSCTRRDDISSP
jgi:hypothetical protein